MQQETSQQHADRLLEEDRAQRGLSPAERRGRATQQIRETLVYIGARVEKGPTRRAPTSDADAARFEAIVAKLEEALAAAIAMSDGL